MSKAFTRESDSEEQPALPPRASLPPGVKNYITPRGAERLRQELAQLAAAGPGPEREMRSRQLQDIISSLVITEPPTDRSVVRFGATVMLQRGRETMTCRLVGVDETDLDQNEISWLSPLAKALLGKRAGDTTPFQSPEGNVVLKVLTVTFE